MEYKKNTFRATDQCGGNQQTNLFFILLKIPVEYESTESAQSSTRYTQNGEREAAFIAGSYNYSLKYFTYILKA